MNITKVRDFYTYNLKQAEFFIKKGLIPNKIDSHNTTKRVFFQFMRDENLEKVLTQWAKRKR